VELGGVEGVWQMICGVELQNIERSSSKQALSLGNGSQKMNKEWIGLNQV
jgi:hypothetical protein